MASDFPPFKSIRTITGYGDRSYVIGAMFTDKYSDKAERLATSCKKFNLPFFLYEVPTVHRSISRRGTDNLSYTKPNFIHHLLETYKKPVLYIDADCEFVSEPVLIDELVKSRCDFAIYNWYADECTDMFYPIEIDSSRGEEPISKRFYRYMGCVPWYGPSQLQCSGAVQFYRNSFAARSLLTHWHRAIQAFPTSADDQILSFTYNNLTRRSLLTWLLRAEWLPKSYCRYAYWIYVKPIINHPDIPAPLSDFKKTTPAPGLKYQYRSQMERRDNPGPLPRDRIVDTEQHVLCAFVDGHLVPVEPIDQEIWI